MKSHKFNRAHFPVGTLFQAASLFKDEVLEVSGVSCNGPDSWVVTTTTPEPAFTHGGFKSINITWVDTIVKRGDGPVLILSHSAPGACMQSAYKGGWFTIVNSMMDHHPAYFDLVCDHLYDYSSVIEALEHRFGERYYVGKINKKKFHKVFKAALVKAKTKRRIAQQADEDMDRQMYLEDMNYEDMCCPPSYNDEEDHLDSSEID
jgi:hypothetical protein